MKCSICNNTSAQKICYKCQKLYRKATKKEQIELFNYNNPRGYKETYKYHDLSVDENNYLITVKQGIERRTSLIFELRYIKNIDFYFEPTWHHHGNMIMHISLLKPNITIDIIIAKGLIYDCEKINSEINMLNTKIDDMIENFLMEREERMERTKHMITSSDEEITLDKAKTAFFLSDNYTKKEAKKQWILLLKAFHPDEGGKDEYAQKINKCYQTLINNLSE